MLPHMPAGLPMFIPEYACVRVSASVSVCAYECVCVCVRASVSMCVCVCVCAQRLISSHRDAAFLLRLSQMCRARLSKMLQGRSPAASRRGLAMHELARLHGAHCLIKKKLNHAQYGSVPHTHHMECTR